MAGWLLFRKLAAALALTLFRVRSVTLGFIHSLVHSFIYPLIQQGLVPVPVQQWTRRQGSDTVGSHETASRTGEQLSVTTA